MSNVPVQETEQDVGVIAAEPKGLQGTPQYLTSDQREYDNLKQEAQYLKETNEKLNLRNEELTRQLEEMGRKLEETRTQLLYKEQELSLSRRAKTEELANKDKIIDDQNEDLINKNAMIKDLEERKQHAQAQNAEFVKMQRREREAIDEVTKLRSKLSIARHQEDYKQKYKDKKNKTVQLEAEVAGLKSQIEQLKRSLERRQSRFEVQPVRQEIHEEAESSHSLFSEKGKMSTDVSPVHSPVMSPGPSRKRGRFSSEPNTNQQCKNCRAIIDHTSPSKGPCRFHMSLPQPFSVWKATHPEEAQDESKKNFSFWPCCSKFSKKTPTGCRQLPNHDPDSS